MVNAPALVRSKYDVALTLDMPNGDAMTQFVVSLSAQRNARTTTVRAWTAENSEDSLPRHLKPCGAPAAIHAAAPNRAATVHREKQISAIPRVGGNFDSRPGGCRHRSVTKLLCFNRHPGPQGAI